MKDEQKKIKEKAKKVSMITMENARLLPGFLGKIAPVQLSLYGWYAHNSNGSIIYYELTK